MGVFDVLVEPCDHFPQRVFDGFSSDIAVRFMRKTDVSDCSAIAADRLVKSLALNRKRPRVVVICSVNQQDRNLDLSAAANGDIVK